MNLTELKEHKISELLKHAKELNIDGASGMRKQDLIFAILQAQTEKDGLIYSEGVIEILPGAIGTDMLAGSNRPPEALEHDAYRKQAQRVEATRQPMQGVFTPSPEAASAIVDSILDDDGPLRHACDPMGEALLSNWRAASDEESMQGMLNLFAPPSDDD